MTSHTYLDLSNTEIGGGTPINLWWSADQPDRVHLAFQDPLFAEMDGTRPGLRVVFSSNPRSADYNPGNFNRCARRLRALGRPAPASDAPEYPRHLKRR